MWVPSLSPQQRNLWDVFSSAVRSQFPFITPVDSSALPIGMTPFPPLLRGSVWNVSEGTHMDSMVKGPRLEGEVMSCPQQLFLRLLRLPKNALDFC